MDIIKIAIIVIIAVILIVLVKELKPEFAIYITIATSLIVLILIFGQLHTVSKEMFSIYSKITTGKEYIPIIIKILAVSYITEFTIQLCNDAGEKALGLKVEFAGKIIIFYISLPIFISIFNLLNKLL